MSRWISDPAAEIRHSAGPERGTALCRPGLHLPSGPHRPALVEPTCNACQRLQWQIEHKDRIARRRATRKRRLEERRKERRAGTPRKRVDVTARPARFTRASLRGAHAERMLDKARGRKNPPDTEIAAKIAKGGHVRANLSRLHPDAKLSPPHHARNKALRT